MPNNSDFGIFQASHNYTHTRLRKSDQKISLGTGPIEKKKSEFYLPVCVFKWTRQVFFFFFRNVQILILFIILGFFFYITMGGTVHI